MILKCFDTICAAYGCSKFSIFPNFKWLLPLSSEYKNTKNSIYLIKKLSFSKTYFS